MRIMTRRGISSGHGLTWCYRAFFAAVNAPRFERASSVPKGVETVGPPLPRSSPSEGTAISRMGIPRLGLSVLVAEGTSSHTLRLGAGHIPGTAFPGQTGNVGIAAHRDTYFRKLQSVRTGDIITLTTPASSWRYAVEWTQVVQPTDTAVLHSAGNPVLTLVTCYRFY
jgi:sortase A